MSQPQPLLLTIAGAFLCYALFHCIKILHEEFTSPLRDLAGPKSPNLLLGHFRQLLSDASLTRKWREEFGPNFQFRGLFNQRELYISDPKALNYIVVNSYIFQKPPLVRRNLSHLLGNGLLSVEMDEHKRQRRILNPAFGVAQIRDLTETFVEKSVQLRDVWAREIAEDGKSKRIDVLSWLRKMTLDVIGQAGFNYQFGAMQPKGKPNELNEVFTQLFHSGQSKTLVVVRVAQASLPILRFLPMPGGRVFQDAKSKMLAIGSELLAQSKVSVKAAGESTMAGRRDLLSILVKANMATDIPGDQRLSDADVIAQVPTFFTAGHETTSTATAWALHGLSINQAAQERLRDELLRVSTDNPKMDELNALPYLESVVRETMRAYSPVAFTGRMAMADDMLPLSKPYIDTKGRKHDTLTIRKGQRIHISIAALHLDEDIWGKDALDFVPDRWDNTPEAARAIPGVWANLFTFLAGSHHCIGSRFTLVEMKALLFTLVRAFEFERAVPEGGIGRTATPVQRPVVLSEVEKGSQMPLIVRPYRGV
ncbi:cytochrome P450 [Mycena sp. CBHHK59/15]|nr:cytochrome P450 [Mycena sp. CBHHK59/15]